MTEATDLYNTLAHDFIKPDQLENIFYNRQQIN